MYKIITYKGYYAIAREDGMIVHSEIRLLECAELILKQYNQSV